MVQQILHPLTQRQAVQSPHILPVLDWGLDGSRAYIATAPPRGTTLRYVLDHEDIDFRRVIELSRQIVLGLKALQTQGITGIDLRPHLITVDTTGIEDRVQLDDVGLRIMLSSFGYTNNHQDDDYGSLDPRYAPPEYLTGGQVGVWSDIYQVGLILFEMATGRLPFVGRTTAETGVMQNSTPVPRMNGVKHDVPVVLQPIVDIALAKNPAQRYPNVDALLKALEEVRIPQRISRPLHTAQGHPAMQPGLTTEMPPLAEETTLHTPLHAQIGSGIPVQGIPSEEGIYAYLVYEKDGVETVSLPITEKNIVVGRLDPKRGVSPDIDLSEIDPRMTVSRQHVRIRFEENFFYIEDLKSRNKTRLGESTLTPLHAELLQHGDVVRIGSVQLIFKIPGMS
jgi:serine/threonine protein kinase